MKICILYIIITVCFGPCSGFKSYAEVPAIGPPLIYKYDRKGPINLELELVTAAGTIKSISAFWEFEGEVRLEASANGGSSYTRIINGLPLAGGFVSGNQLRFRISISKESILKKLTIGYTDTSNAAKAFYNPELASFKFKKQIYISGANRELFNYPIKIKIEREGVFKNGIVSDFRDVRFISADGQIPLAYYLENGYSDQAAIFWVKIPEIPKEGIKVYLYCGNKNAASASNPEAVFPFFDDFNNTNLDENKWLPRYELKPEAIVREGVLCLRDSSVISRAFKMKEGVLEFKAKAEKNTAIQGIASGSAINSPFTIEETVYSSSYPGAEHTIAINDVAKLNIGSPIEPMTDYIYRVIVNSEGIIFQRENKNYGKEAEIRFLDTYKLDRGYIGLKAVSAPFGEGSVYFDWVRVRPYVEPEPKAVIEN